MVPMVAKVSICEIKLLSTNIVLHDHYQGTLLTHPQFLRGTSSPCPCFGRTFIQLASRVTLLYSSKIRIKLIACINLFFYIFNNFKEVQLSGEDVNPISHFQKYTFLAKKAKREGVLGDRIPNIDTELPDCCQCYHRMPWKMR